MHLKLPQRETKKTAEASGDLIGSNFADKTEKVSRTSPQNNSETVTNEEENIGLDIKMYRERYLSPEKDRKLLMIEDSRNSIIMEYQKIIDLLDNTPNQPSKVRTRNWVE